MDRQHSLPVIGIIGGDRRQEYLTDIFQNLHYSVMTYGVSGEKGYSTGTLRELMEHSTVIIAPVPFSHNGKTIFSLSQKEDLDISSFLFFLKPDHIVFGGNFPECVSSRCLAENILFSDLLKNDRIASLNAIATAEGAIMESCRLSPMNFYKNHSIVIGYGRCGSVLADRLRGLHSQVTVCARSRKARTEAEILGFDAIDFASLGEALKDACFVFNTVPAPVLSETLLQQLPPQAVILDIASAPGGVDFKAASSLGITSSLFLSIPGKTAPYASAVILADEIISFLHQRALPECSEFL